MAYGSYLRGGQSFWKTLFMGHMKTLLEAEGWTTINNAYDDGTRTRWVFKSATGTFYMVFWTTTSQLSSDLYNSAGLTFTLCEDYNDTNKTIIKPVVTSTSNAFAPASDGSLGTTEYTLAGVINSGVGVLGIMQGASIYSSTPDEWIINVFPNLLSVTLRSNSNNGPQRGYFVAGEFVSLVDAASTNDPVCLGYRGDGTAWSNITNPLQGSGFTRSAMNGGKAAHTWGAAGFVWVNSTFHDHFSVVSNNWDRYAGAVGPSLSPVALRRNNVNDINLYGSLRALVPKLLYGATGGLMDDVITIGSNEYVCSAMDRYWLRKG